MAARPSYVHELYNAFKSTCMLNTHLAFNKFFFVKLVQFFPTVHLMQHTVTLPLNHVNVYSLHTPADHCFRHYTAHAHDHYGFRQSNESIFSAVNLHHSKASESHSIIHTHGKSMSAYAQLFTYELFHIIKLD